MGLFDKIKDNAKTISMKAFETIEEEGAVEGVNNTVQPTKTNANTDSKTSPEPVKEVVNDTETDKVAVAEILAEVETTIETEPQPENEEIVTEVEDADIFEVANEALEEPPTTPEVVEKVELPKAIITKPDKPEKSVKTAVKEPVKLTVKQAPQNTTPANQEEYIPYYKKDMAKTSNGKRIIDVEKVLATGTNRDIKRQKVEDPEKRAILNRERNAIIELSNQRRLEGKIALYTTSHLNFKTRVFINRIEYSGTFGKNVLPIEQVAWIRLRHGGTGVMIETTEGKKVVMVIGQKDRLAFADAVMKMQSLIPKVRKLKDDKTVRLDLMDKLSEDVDDIERIASLYKRGLITKSEFELKKKQILDL